jgi:hypothetical protein
MKAKSIKGTPIWMLRMPDGRHASLDLNNSCSQINVMLWKSLPLTLLLKIAAI